MNKEENIDCHKIIKRILLCCIKLNFIHKNKQSGKSINTVSNRDKCSYMEKPKQETKRGSYKGTKLKTQMGK